MMLETPAQVSQFIDQHVQYKPGTEIWVDDSDNGIMGIVRVQVSGVEQDSRDPNKAAIVNYTRFIPLPVSEEVFVEHLYQAIVKRAIHEVKEWYKVRGEWPHRPHERGLDGTPR